MTVSKLDLTSIAIFKNWAGISASSINDDDVIQQCITAWGSMFLWLTGYGDQNGDLTQSPFNSICDFNETYDGKGTYRLFLNNRPIRSVTAVNINGIAVQQSSGYAVQGWVVDGTGKSISLRSSLTGWGTYGTWGWPSGPFSALGSGLRFWRGVQNINVQYSAGYDVTPLDIQTAANVVVLQNYKRRKYQDEATRSMSGGAGSTRYQNWSIPPEVQTVVESYARTL